MMIPTIKPDTCYRCGKPTNLTSGCNCLFLGSKCPICKKYFTARESHLCFIRSPHISFNVETDME